MYYKTFKAHHLLYSGKMLLTFRRLNAAPNDDDLDDNDAHILLNKPVQIRRTCTMSIM